MKIISPTRRRSPTWSPTFSPTCSPTCSSTCSTDVLTSSRLLRCSPMGSAAQRCSPSLTDVFVDVLPTFSPMCSPACSPTCSLTCSTDVLSPRANGSRLLVVHRCGSSLNDVLRRSPTCTAAHRRALQMCSRSPMCHGDMLTDVHLAVYLQLYLSTSSLASQPHIQLHLQPLTKVHLAVYYGG